MPRQRGFDEDDAAAAAGKVFAARGYEGTSVDDLVVALGVHRGSLYRTFGSKLELFHRALADSVERDVLPWIVALCAAFANDASGDGLLVAGTAAGGVDLGLFLVAAVERAPVDPIAAKQVARVFDALTAAFTESGGTDDATAAGLAAALVGLRIRARAGASAADVERAAVALTARLHH